ncbi:class I lanthipeptide [uncultured Dokdonia sp.]|uniref:class I lanthipeptide n=1 Tax=uncultured Dokdonia sp. TaxID=575653 RepID=UPI00262C88B1|nr:class I lanthipeptide [uncultured Dokdonia sp.]
MRKESLKKLSLDKLTISKLTDSEAIMGGSGICDISDRPMGCPPAKTYDRPICPQTDQANGC